MAVLLLLAFLLFLASPIEKMYKIIVTQPVPLRIMFAAEATKQHTGHTWIPLTWRPD